MSNLVKTFDLPSAVQDMKEFKNQLASFSPSNVDECIGMLAIRSAFKSAEKEYTATCYDYLNNINGRTDEAFSIESSTGIKATRLLKTVREYTAKTKRLKALESKLESANKSIADIKLEIKLEQERSKFRESKEFHGYKIS